MCRVVLFAFEEGVGGGGGGQSQEWPLRAAALPGRHDRHEGGQKDSDEQVAVVRGAVGGIAFVLLAEAHPSFAAALRHADVIHHKQVNLDVVCAAAAHLQVRWKLMAGGSN